MYGLVKTEQRQDMKKPESQAASCKNFLVLVQTTNVDLWRTGNPSLPVQEKFRATYFGRFKPLA